MLVVLVVLLVAAYLLPSTVAVARRVPSTRSVLILNVLLGWTLVGWAIAFARALREPGGAADRVATDAEDEPAPRPAAYYAGWRADPFGRHELRYFDGTVWTAQVSDAGEKSIDAF